jgi:hypothetical protein
MIRITKIINLTYREFLVAKINAANARVNAKRDNSSTLTNYKNMYS